MPKNITQWEQKLLKKPVNLPKFLIQIFSHCETRGNTETYTKLGIRKAEIPGISGTKNCQKLMQLCFFKHNMENRGNCCFLSSKFHLFLFYNVGGEPPKNMLKTTVKLQNYKKESQ